MFPCELLARRDFGPGSLLLENVEGYGPDRGYQAAIRVGHRLTTEHTFRYAPLFSAVEGVAHKRKFLDCALLQIHLIVRVQNIPKLVVVHVFVGLHIGGRHVVSRRVSGHSFDRRREGRVVFTAGGEQKYGRQQDYSSAKTSRGHGRSP